MELVIQSSGVSSRPGLQGLRRSSILQGDNGGTRFMFDTATPWCVPAAAPVAGQTVRDMAEIANGAYRVAAAQTVTYAGGGYDFSAMTADPAEVVGGAGCLSAIHAGLQYFMVAGWFKLPISGDWNTNALLAPMFCTTTNTNGYTAEADMLTIAQVNTPVLTFRRQTNGGSTVDQINLSPALHYGRVAQLAFWRNAAGQGARINSAGGTTAGALAVGSVNSGDFSAKLARFGVTESFNNLPALAEHRAASNTRLFRGWVENLQVSGRDPLTVLDADYAFVTTRGAFS